jgi:hypothetical protein
MFRKYLSMFVSTCLVISFLVSCTMPASKGPTVIPSVAVTQAVQTMSAKLTSTPAVTSQPTVLPTREQATAIPGEPTNTLIPPTATPKPEIIATSTAVPEGTLNPNDPIAGLGNPDWHETFDGTGAWYTYQDEFIRFQAQENKLEMTAFQANNRNGWALVPKLLSQKYYAEMTATFGDTCKGADHYGLMISPVSSADKGYLYGISCDGKYILWKWDGTRMTTLVKWTASTLLQAGVNKTNRIGIKVVGNKISLFANSSLLTELTDKTYDKLYFGVFVGAAETAKFTVKVNSLNYWVLP